MLQPSADVLWRVTVLISVLWGSACQAPLPAGEPLSLPRASSSPGVASTPVATVAPSATPPAMSTPAQTGVPTARPTAVATPRPTPEPMPRSTQRPTPTPTPGPESVETEMSRNDQILADAFAARKSNLQVQGEGEVSRILADDRDGSQHQRFILTLSSGQTLLVAHNIDLAPRIDALRMGDRVSFWGEYEWNAQGGVIHWTHKDPQGVHENGWLKHKGQQYD